MNIFEALSQGDGRINETNTSSFLAYLLKENESHGLKREFLKRFLNKIGFEVDLSDVNITIELERKFGNIDGISQQERHIDILITLDNEINKTVIGIENKINIGACSKNQLLDEYKCLKQTFNKDDIKLIFLTPKLEGVAQKEWNALNTYLKEKNQEQNADCLLWKNTLEIIKTMIKDEHDMNISPLSDYLKQTLKAFCCYINYLLNIDTQIKQKVKVIYSHTHEEYILLQLSNGTIRIDCANREGLIVKDMIRDVLFELKKKGEKRTDEWYKTGEIGTTQDLGKKMFNELKTMQTITISDPQPYFSFKNKRAGSNIF